MYKFSQSGLKDLEDPINCPFRWKASHVDHTEEYKLGEAAQWGKFFEYLCLGTDTGCTSIHKLKSGKMSVMEKRVRDQAEVFKQMHNKDSSIYIGEVVFKADILLETDTRKGIIDYTTTGRDGKMTWWDLKLVADLYNGFYKYGNHKNANYDQQVFYSKLITDNQYTRPKMGLLVFESGAKARIKRIMLDVSDSSVELMDNRVRTAENVVSEYNRKGWTKVPHIDECKKCSIKCDLRLEEIIQEDKQVTEKELLEEAELKI